MTDAGSVAQGRRRYAHGKRSRSVSVCQAVRVVRLTMSESGASSSVVKHQSGKLLRSGEKRVILNVFNTFLQKNPNFSIKEIAGLTAEFTGVSISSVFKLRKEDIETGKLETPKKTRKRKKPVAETYDDFVVSAVRTKVHSFFFRNEPPTLAKVLQAVNSDPDLPGFKRTSLYNLIVSSGFVFQKRGQKNLIIDRDDIVLWRRNYLRNIRLHREQNKKNYYLDETWVTEGHTTDKVWADSTVKNKKQAFLAGLSAGLKNPSGKGRRLIVAHIGSEAGFVEGALFVFESKKTADYHEEMTGDTFSDWFVCVLSLLEPNSVIVLDNAPYHSVKLIRRPNKSWRKADIAQWLSEKGEHFESTFVKAELLKLTEKYSTEFDKFVIDEIAKQRGFEVLRLPPYHCNLNPIELVWSQVKGYVARNNKTFKLREVHELLEQGISEVTPERWCSAVRHTIKEEQRMWEVDGFSDSVVDEIVITNDSSSSTASSASDIEGIEPLPEAE